MLNLLKYWWQEVLLALVALGAVVLCGLLVVSTLGLHLAEMQWQIRRGEFLEGNLSHTYLVTRLLDQYRLYQDSITLQELDEREFRYSTLLDHSTYNWERLQYRGKIDKMSLVIINALRQATGKPPLASEREVEVMALLERAFQWERTRNYATAMNIYADIQPSIQNERMQGVIGLHQGVCSALLGKTDQARDLFGKVILVHGGSDLGAMASSLLSYLEILIREREVVRQGGFDVLTKARKMSALLQCRELLAIENIAGVKESSPQTELTMLHARCKEEVGDRAGAIVDYSEVILRGGSGEFARDANRRLFILGSQVNDGGKLQAISLRVNQSLQDSSIGRMQGLEASLASLPRSIPVAPAPDSSTVRELEGMAESVQQEPVLALVKEPGAQAVPEVEVEKEPTPLPPIGSKVRVEMQGGKTFVGRLLEGSGEQNLQIQTMIGVINVLRSDVVSLTSE